VSPAFSGCEVREEFRVLLRGAGAGLERSPGGNVALSGLKGQRRLIFRPINDLKKHPALEHFRLEIRRMFLPLGGLTNANLGSSPRPLSASSDARAPRIPSYIMVRLSFVNA
jgi:hypothetical protein